jgi:protein tyrosine/serine phosphatase
MSLDAAPPPRHVSHDLVFNLRDLGGYRGAGGRATRWGRLYRGDGLHRLGPDDCAALGLVTVLDLRTDREIAERGRLDVDGIDWHHLPVLQDTWDPAWAMPEVAAERFLADRYLVMLAEGEEALGRALRVIADPDRLPAAFHCAAGKDRTGVLAALVLSLVGVDDDTIAADYGLSRHGMDRLVEWIRATYPERVDTMTDQPTPFLQAPDDAMHLFLADLRELHGSVEAYAASVGAGPDVVDSLRANLLEPTAGP